MTPCAPGIHRDSDGAAFFIDDSAPGAVMSPKLGKEVVYSMTNGTDSEVAAT
ncbi:MAG: hypothetical protein BWZ10_02028 [candidate division BRC1 bacterium ADurb.BinA364]|nr:MAG: hypothetical protein BWZ10_02028 [candidate division BRC1 bacterium ADurb.BinA364]